MGQQIKLKCNGATPHEAVIDLDDLKRRTTTVKGAPASRWDELPERSVLRCRLCTGSLIVLRDEVKRRLGE